MKRNKSKQLEFWYKMAKSIAVVGGLLFLVSTVFFNIKYGLHWYAVNYFETWCNKVLGMLGLGLTISMAMCLTELIESEIRLRRGWEGIVKKMDSEDADKILQGLKDEDLEPLEKSAIRNPKSVIE